MKKLKAGEAVITMDPRLRRNPASNEAVEKVLKLARQCLAPSRQSRPTMKKCAEILWEIRKELREKSLVLHAASYHSGNVTEGGVRRNRQDLYGIADIDYYKFYSAWWWMNTSFLVSLFDLEKKKKKNLSKLYMIFEDLNGIYIHSCKGSSINL